MKKQRKSKEQIPKQEKNLFLTELKKEIDK
jgi:hypothetical protein